MYQLIATVVSLLPLIGNPTVPETAVHCRVVVTTSQGQKFAGEIDPRTSRQAVVLCVQTTSSAVRVSIPRSAIKDIAIVPPVAEQTGPASMAEEAHQAIFAR